jgi:hypothetical protein
MIVDNSEEVKTEWSTNLAESSKEGYGCKRAVLPTMIMIIIIIIIIIIIYNYESCHLRDRDVNGQDNGLHVSLDVMENNNCPTSLPEIYPFYISVQ